MDEYLLNKVAKLTAKKKYFDWIFPKVEKNHVHQFSEPTWFKPSICWCAEAIDVIER